MTLPQQMRANRRFGSFGDAHMSADIAVKISSGSLHPVVVRLALGPGKAVPHKFVFLKGEKRRNNDSDIFVWDATASRWKNARAYGLSEGQIRRLYKEAANDHAERHRGKVPRDLAQVGVLLSGLYNPPPKKPETMSAGAARIMKSVEINNKINAGKLRFYRIRCRLALGLKPYKCVAHKFVFLGNPKRRKDSDIFVWDPFRGRWRSARFYGLNEAQVDRLYLTQRSLSAHSEKTLCEKSGRGLGR